MADTLVVFLKVFFKQRFILNKKSAGDDKSMKNKTNSMNLYPPTKVYLRETCKSQNINPIYLTLSSPSVYSGHNKHLSSMF